MIDPTPWAGRPHPGRPTVALPLTPDQRAEVEATLAWPSCPQRVAQRAQALLLMADGVPASDIARLLGVNERTVFKWRVRFGTDRPVSRLTDARRSGRPVSLFRTKPAPASSPPPAAPRPT
jgi:hypothetical protein